MMAAARIRRLNVDPAIRTVDCGDSVSGTGHSVPITLAHSCKLVTSSLLRVSQVESLYANPPDPGSPPGSLFALANPPEALSQPFLKRVINFLTNLQELNVSLSCLKNFLVPTAFAASPALRRLTTQHSSPRAVLSRPI